MKNIHILPTDKPSRLCKALGSHVLWLTKTYDGYNGAIYQHIYITSDEEIKVGDWCYAILSKQVFKNVNPNLKSEDKKKIILTTDQDLINDGVQAIDDEFLEWFVKNPSCEVVEIIMENYYASGALQPNLWRPKIIIPKEEPKQETIEEAAAKHFNKEVFVEGVTIQYALQEAFIEGAKWQQERSYSEEDMIKIVEKSRETGLTAEFLLLTEQFKKK